MQITALYDLNLQRTSEVNRTEHAAHCCYFRGGRIWLTENTNVIKYLREQWKAMAFWTLMSLAWQFAMSHYIFHAKFYCHYHWWQHKVLKGAESSRCSLDSWQKCFIKISILCLCRVSAVQYKSIVLLYGKVYDGFLKFWVTLQK